MVMAEVRVEAGPSIGGDVADFFGTLQARSSNQTYTQSLNPLGNPFEGKSTAEMIAYFSSTYQQPEVLVMLGQRLDSFFGADKGQAVPEDLLPTYTEAKEAIELELSKRKPPTE